MRVPYRTQHLQTTRAWQQHCVSLEVGPLSGATHPQPHQELAASRVRFIRTRLQGCALAGGGGGGCIRRDGTSEVAPEAVEQAVGGGCRSGWGRLLSVTNAIEAGTCRSGDTWAQAGRPEGRGVRSTCAASNASLVGGPKRSFKSGCKSAYRRLEKRLEGRFWRVQGGWRGEGGADRHEEGPTRSFGAPVFVMSAKRRPVPSNRRRLPSNSNNRRPSSPSLPPWRGGGGDPSPPAPAYPGPTWRRPAARRSQTLRPVAHTCGQTFRRIASRPLRGCAACSLQKASNCARVSARTSSVGCCWLLSVMEFACRTSSTSQRQSGARGFQRCTTTPAVRRRCRRAAGTAPHAPPQTGPPTRGRGDVPLVLST